MSSRSRIRVPAKKPRSWAVTLIKNRGVLLGFVEAPDEKTAELAARQFCGVGAAPPIFRGAINGQSNSDLLLGFIFVSLPFEFFQKRGPQKVGDANKFMPRRALNLEEHGVRYAGLDRSAVGSRKYFTALALSKGVGLRLSGHSPSVTSLRLSKDTTAVTGVLFHNASFFGQRTLGILWAAIVCA
jgi:hypothetical protein